MVWAALGAMVPLPSPFFLFLEASWGVLGTSGGVLGTSWALLEASWGRLGSVSGALGGVLGAPWGVLGHLGGVLGASCGILTASRERLQGKPQFLIDFCFQLRPLKLIKSSPRCRESSIFKKSLLEVNINFLFDFRANLAPFWLHFPNPGRSWRPLGPSWGVLGASWRPLGATWRRLGTSWSVLGHLGASWPHLSASWERLGSQNPPNINLSK